MGGSVLDGLVGGYVLDGLVGGSVQDELLGLYWMGWWECLY